MKTHRLKTWPEYFDAVVRGDKTFEVRKDDRAFDLGDCVVLIRFDPDTQRATTPYTITERMITYVLRGGQFGIETGYVVLGLG